MALIDATDSATIGLTSTGRGLAVTVPVPTWIVNLKEDE